MAERLSTSLPPLPLAALEQLLDRSGALVYAIDAEERLLTVNAALRNATEIDLGDVADLGALLRLLYPDPTTRDTIGAAHRAALAGTPPRAAEWALTTALGETRAVRWQLLVPQAGVLVAVGHDLTEQRGLERWVRLQNTLLAGLPDAVVVADLDGRILHWTGGAEATFGPDEVAALGRPLAQIVPGDHGTATVQEWVVLARERGRATFDRELRRENGETLECHVDLARVNDERGAMVGIALRVGAARAAVVALEEPDQEVLGLEKALATVGAGAIILAGMDGTVRGWSAGAERLGGVPAGRARGQRLLDDVLRVQGMSWEGLATRLATRPRHTARVVVERPNGTRFPADLDAVVIRAPAGPQGVVVLVVDRGEVQALADEALLTKTRALPGAFGEGLARRLTDTLTWFEPDHRSVNARLHDLAALGDLVAEGGNTAAIEAFLARTGLRGTPPGVQAAIDRLSDGTARLRAMVEDVARFEAAEPDPPGPVRVAREVEAARLLVGHRVGAELEVAPTVEDLPAARASRTPLLRALCLLLLAAAESSSGADEGRVVVEARHQHGWVHVEVRDNGAGYAVEVQTRLGELPWLASQPGFAPFFLGLARDAVRLAGGTMELVTAPGTGTRVKLSFPAADAAIAVQPLDAPRASAAAHGRVLVIEEDELLRRGIERFVAETHHVRSFATVADALPVVASSAFDGAVVGLERPEFLGLKLLLALVEAAPTLQRNLVVLVPASLRSSTRDALVDRGHLVLARPVDLTTLRSVLLRLIPPEELALDEGLE